MTSARVEGAAKGAQVGGTIGGPIGSGVGAILGGLFSKGSYAQATGYEISGQISHRGFEGTVVGLAQNKGERYRDPATGEQFYLNATAADRWTKAGLTADDAPIPFSGTIPYDFNIAFKAVEDAVAGAAARKGGSVLDAIRGSTGAGPAALGNVAPMVSVSSPAGVPTPSSMQPASILPAQSQESSGGALPLLALLFGAAYVMR